MAILLLCVGITLFVGLATLLWAALLTWQYLVLNQFDRWQAALRTFQAVTAIAVIVTALQAI